MMLRWAGVVIDDESSKEGFLYEIQLYGIFQVN